MTVSQVGVFRHGSYGLAVIVTLGAANVPLANVTNIHLDMTHSFDEAITISRDLPLSGTPPTIVDATVGIVQWIVQNGDLPESGTYNFTLTITMSTPAVIISDGSFKVV